MRDLGSFFQTIKYKRNRGCLAAGRLRQSFGDGAQAGLFAVSRLVRDKFLLYI